MRLPIGASSIVLAASEGRRASLVPEQSSRPLDRLAATLGIRSGLGIPLTLGGSPLGALALLWESEQPPVATAPTPAIRNESELLRSLLAPVTRQPSVLVCHEDALLAGGLARLTEQLLDATVMVALSVEQALTSLAARRPDLIVCSDQLSPGKRLAEVAGQLRAAGTAAPCS